MKLSNCVLIRIAWKMKLSNCVSLITNSMNRRRNHFPFVIALCVLFLLGTAIVINDYREKVSSWEASRSKQAMPSNSCEIQCRPSGVESLPRGIVSGQSNLEMQQLWGSPRHSKKKSKPSSSKSILAIAVGIKQKEVVDQIVQKFSLKDFVIMLFHYDGFIDEWRDLQWSGSALHVSAINQTKWWFAKRFLHPDIVAEYKYIFLWDEDLGVENFDPGRYLSIIEREGLEISQPALDSSKSKVHHRITARWRKGDVHRRIYNYRAGGHAPCDENSTGPPCTGWVEMMAPVFSRAAWRCVWHMVQNDLIHAWGLDMKLGYCAQGDRSKNVGVVDSEYIVHKGLPTLGHLNDEKVDAKTLDHHSETKSDKSNAEVLSRSPVSNDRYAVRSRSYAELEMFRRRWNRAVSEDKCWIDPHALSKTKTKTNH